MHLLDSKAADLRFDGELSISPGSRAQSLDDVAEMYLVKSRDAYRCWDAHGKVRQLEARHPGLAKADLRGATREEPSPNQQFDVATVVKASQALSSEILLPSLIGRCGCSFQSRGLRHCPARYTRAPRGTGRRRSGGGLSHDQFAIAPRPHQTTHHRSIWRQ